MSSAIFNYPAYKTFIKQLNEAQMNKPQPQDKFLTWKVPFLGGQNINTTNVWIQGEILDLSMQSQANLVEKMIISDGSGTVEVTGVNRIPRPSNYNGFKVNDKVLVIGYVMQAGKQSVIIKAMKVTDLNDDKTYDKWHQEVGEAQKAVVESQSP